LGVYFTDIEPSPANLRTLYKKLRIPKTKQEFAFWFLGTDGLSQLNNGQGRDKRIFYSPVDIEVAVDRERGEGNTDGLQEMFS